MTLASHGGVLIGFLFGNYLSYDSIPKISLIFPALFIVTYPFFPESPWFLLKAKKFKVHS